MFFFFFYINVILSLLSLDDGLWPKLVITNKKSFYITLVVYVVLLNILFDFNWK